MTADIQKSKKLVENAKTNLLDIQTSVFKLLQKYSPNLLWYDHWTYICREQIDQMQFLFELHDKCQRLIDSMKPTDKSAKWHAPIFESLNDAKETMLTWNLKLSTIFQKDFDQLMNILKLLKNSGSEDQVNELNTFLITFDLNTSSLRSQISFTLNQFNVRLDYIEFEIKQWRMGNAPLEPKDSLGKFIPVASGNIMGKAMERLSDDFEPTFEILEKTFLCLKIGMTSMLEDTLNDNLMVESRPETIKSEKIQSKESNTRSSAIAPHPVFNKFDSFVINIQNMMSNTFKLYHHTQKLKWKITSSTVDILSKRSMLYSSVVVGFFKSLTIKLVKVNNNIKKVRTIIDNLKADRPNAEEIKKINLIFDNLVKTSYEQDLSSLNNLFVKFGNNLFGDESNLDSKLFDSISIYDINRNLIIDIIARQMKLVSEMETILSSSSAK